MKIEFFAWPLNEVFGGSVWIELESGMGSVVGDLDGRKVRLFCCDASVPVVFG